MRFNVDSLFIQVSGVTTEDDALFAIALGATAVAFDFTVSPRQVGPALVHDIVRRLPQGALSIGSFRNELPQRVVEIANTIGLSAVQLEGVWGDDHVKYIAQRVNTVLRRIGADTDPAMAQRTADYVVIPEEDDVFALGSSLDQFVESDARHPLIASGGLDETNVAEVVRHYPIFGVEARSRVEREPGVLDPASLGGFISQARWGYERSEVERDFRRWSI